MLFKFFEIMGINKFARKHLNDPVNWVAFIRRFNLSKKEQIQWRNRLNLDHHFDGEFRG